MNTIENTFDDYSAISLNAYFHLKAACIQIDMIASDRKKFENKIFVKQALSARKESRIFITEIERAYMAAGIDISQIEKENEAIAEASEIMARITDKLVIKPRLKLKM